MRREALEDLADSLTRERAFKGFVVVCLVVALAAMGPKAHTYLPIILFALLADVIALNRLRRLVNTLVHEAKQAALSTDDEGEDGDE